MTGHPPAFPSPAGDPPAIDTSVPHSARIWDHPVAQVPVTARIGYP